MYEKSKDKKLDKILFENPTAEYRAAPFWAWNCVLNKDELLWQIERLKEMGMGGFHIHCRDGMATEYLSKDFMSLVEACVDKAEKEGMFAYLYDEDKYPSGFAGGLVTKDVENRMRYITLCSKKRSDAVSFSDALATGKPAFLAAYDIALNDDGELVSYNMIGEDETARNLKRYVYFMTFECSDWFNRQAYVNTLSKKAIDKFIEITHEQYKKSVGKSFGKSVPSIFTDEPRFMIKQPLSSAFSEGEAIMPWYEEAEADYQLKYGASLLQGLPEVFWNLPNGKPSKIRYNFHDFICARFTACFAENYGKWCSDNGLLLTGHMMEEDTLYRQACAIGEAMRAYAHFGIPGIDMLCNERCFNTAKQAQSSVHQYSKAGMMSELYGVTNWDFDFRGHKFQGDWQAALGVTLRVPHLSWVSMKGSAKRDYPATMNYQVPWYKEYPYVEDHFARLGTVLTRGRPEVRVGVIHTVESMWINLGPNENTANIRESLDADFENLTRWLLSNHIDFDFVCESTLPEQMAEITQKLTVGAMNYDVILVPSAQTLRFTTVEILSKFVSFGGKVIFAGSLPQFVDAIPSDLALKLASSCECIPFSETSVITALDCVRDVAIIRKDGKTAKDMLYALRSDGDEKWLFIARMEQTIAGYTADVGIWQDISVRVRGEYTPTLYNTVTGKTEKLGYYYSNGNTVITKRVYASDSLLINLSEKSCENKIVIEDERIYGTTRFFVPMDYTLEEGNVLLLDIADYHIDDEPFTLNEEVVRISDKSKARLGYPTTSCQPWVMESKPFEHTVTVRYKFNVLCDLEGLLLATEDVERAKITFNGTPVSSSPVGYFRDKDIKTVALPNPIIGENVVEITTPFGARDFVEASYVIGYFGVELKGTQKYLVPIADKIGFGDLCPQGFPFYGGNVTYKTVYEAESNQRIRIRLNGYAGACVRVFVDGKDLGIVAYSPFAVYTDVEKGTHNVEFKLYGSLINTFGSLHNGNEAHTWYGPSDWQAPDEWFRYEYRLRKTGILASPVIDIVK